MNSRLIPSVAGFGVLADPIEDLAEAEFVALQGARPLRLSRGTTMKANLSDLNVTAQA